jgi:hypothetical protein
MATIIIDNSSTQAEQLLNYISTLPFVTVVKEKKKSFAEASAECNAISADEFIDELKTRVKQRYHNAKG